MLGIAVIQQQRNSATVVPFIIALQIAHTMTRRGLHGGRRIFSKCLVNARCMGEKEWISYMTAIATCSYIHLPV